MKTEKQNSVKEDGGFDFVERLCGGSFGKGKEEGGGYGEVVELGWFPWRWRRRKMKVKGLEKL